MLSKRRLELGFVMTSWVPTLHRESAVAQPSMTERDEAESWPDSRLVAAVRSDAPDETALDVLVDRHWKALFARCHILTLDDHKARDLAQEAWCRVLRARRGLKPEGNFPGYLVTVATNIWRDANRSARRAGAMADQRLLSLNAPLSGEEGDCVLLGDVLPDLNTLAEEKQKALEMDLDQALARLEPLLRDVLISRLVVGESAAEIGRRYDRTEQTVSGWVRQAIRELRDYLEERDGPVGGG